MWQQNIHLYSSLVFSIHHNKKEETVPFALAYANVTYAIYSKQLLRKMDRQTKNVLGPTSSHIRLYICYYEFFSFPNLLTMAIGNKIT